MLKRLFSRAKQPLLNKVDTSVYRLEKIILDTLDFNDVVQKVVDSILFELGYRKLGYRIVVLALYDEKKNLLRRTSVSQTPEARDALKVLPLPFKTAHIPLQATDNYCVKAFKQEKPFITHTWEDILTPPFTKEEAIFSQQKAGIQTSMVYPLIVHGKAMGIMIFSLEKSEKEVSKEEKELLSRFTDIVGLAVQNAGLYSTLADTTSRLRKANARLKELDQLKDEFVSIASHELRTPMTAIKSYLWLALNKYQKDMDPQLQKYLDISYKSTERLIHLVNDMLTVSRIERNKIEIKREKMDLRDVAQQVYDELKIKADERDISFTLTPKKGTFMVNGDKEKLREVVQNIVGNSLKFTPDGGSISIDLSYEEGDICVKITDTGPGISPKDMDKLFGKFEKLESSYTTTHSSQPGSGLGLYISKQIAKMHDGDIKVESELGKGSTFTIVIPST